MASAEPTSTNPHWALTVYWALSGGGRWEHGDDQPGSWSGGMPPNKGITRHVLKHDGWQKVTGDGMRKCLWLYWKGICSWYRWRTELSGKDDIWAKFREDLRKLGGDCNLKGRQCEGLEGRSNMLSFKISTLSVTSLFGQCLSTVLTL